MRSNLVEGFLKRFLHLRRGSTWNNLSRHVVEMLVKIRRVPGTLPFKHARNNIG
jgi:hypothetical protein